jgi:hypothetical protein
MRTTLLASVLFVLVGMSLPASASGGSIITVSVPGSTSTMLNGINDAGVSVGTYSDGTSSSGFIRGSTGAITTFVVPGSFSTFGQGVNDAGVVVGDYEATLFGTYQGYVRTMDGTFSTFNVPGADSTYANSINNLGQIAGTYSLGGLFSGFVLNPNGSLTKIDVPGATWTFAEGIAGSGAVVGYYFDGTSFGAFLRSPNGTFRTFEIPGGSSTFAAGINDSGQLVGYYLTSYFDSSGLVTLSTGVIRNPDGSITTFDVPGSTSTYIQGINNQGQLAGSYVNNGITYGFLSIPEPSPLVLLGIGISYVMLAGRDRRPR